MFIIRGTMAESLRKSKMSSGPKDEAEVVPGVRGSAGVVERDDREKPENASPTNWSRYGSGADPVTSKKREEN